MISVVVPVRNGMPWLEDQIRALVAQEYDGAWEVDHRRQRVDRRQSGSCQALVGALPDGSGAWTPPRCTAHRPPATPACGRPRATCWPSATPTTSCSPAGSPAAPGPSRRSTWWPGVFDFWSLNGLQSAPPKPASMRQFGFLPAGLGANLAVRRSAFESVGGFRRGVAHRRGHRPLLAAAVRGLPLRRSSSAPWWPSGSAPGSERCSSRRPPTAAAGRPSTAGIDATGARRNLGGAARSWLWLILLSPRLARPGAQRLDWARAAGMRTGRLAGSLSERVFFP